MIKRNRFLFFFGKKVRKVQHIFIWCVVPSTVFNIKRLLRVFRINKNNPYEKLKTIKKKHKGERCFIVATGPSLTMEDIEKLRNEVTFSMNSICLAFDETDWRPTYYGIQDENVYANVKEHLHKIADDSMFISDTIPKQINIKVSEESYLFPLNMLNHNINHKKYHTKFSSDIFSSVYSGYSITYCLLQIAVYMGFEEIILLGVDCHYSSNMKHHFKEYGFVDPDFPSVGEMMMGAFRVAKEYADRNNIKILNATRGGMLEVFERVDLDTLFTETQQLITDVRS